MYAVKFDRGVFGEMFNVSSLFQHYFSSFGYTARELLLYFRTWVLFRLMRREYLSMGQTRCSYFLLYEVTIPRTTQKCFQERYEHVVVSRLIISL